mmetsp:Transcript_977/g.1846  ORF Transcript_977/g.1846 Transcript_977/m.1846 type:complete len:87 (-) Transcript_977:1205-1465(-)
MQLELLTFSTEIHFLFKKTCRSYHVVVVSHLYYCFTSSCSHLTLFSFVIHNKTLIQIRKTVSISNVVINQVLHSKHSSVDEFAILL